jgi:hypothetical protein
MITLEEQNKISKQILNKMIKENYSYIQDGLPNKEYLEVNLGYLERVALQHKQQSENLKIAPHLRARARDLLQNCYGLINGIKFSISFLDHQKVNLFEYEPKQEDK